jgi:hypothetical protein
MVRPEDREVFRRIGEAESEPRKPPESFSEALKTLDRLIARRCSMFPGRSFSPTDEEFRAHEALYVRARALGIYRG